MFARVRARSEAHNHKNLQIVPHNGTQREEAHLAKRMRNTYSW